MRVRSKLLAVAAGLLLGGSLLLAAVLAPAAGPVAPDVFSIGYSGTQKAYTATPFPTFSTNGGSITGEVLMQVVADPSNAFCSGCLDFIFQINNDSSSTANINHVTFSGYSGYSTDAGYDSQSVGGGTECGPADNGYCNTSGQGVLGTVARDATGNIMTFTFSGSGLAPGQSSVDFVIETNAHTFVSAATSVFGANGTSASNIGGVFSPTSSAPPPPTTPIPSTAILGVTGLAGLALFYRWRRHRERA